jgi:predicted transcriptional regulator
VIPEKQPPAKYRSQMRIYVDIMRVIQKEGNNAKPTRILYGANLSHDRLTKYLDELKSLGIIEQVADAEERHYRLSQKGIEFLNEFRRLENFAAAFGFTI